MEDNLVVKSNSLVEAAYTMSTKEKEILLACISQIDSRINAPEVVTQTKFTLQTSDIKSLFYNSTNAHNANRDIQRASESLYDREVFIRQADNKILRTRFLSSILYSPDTAEVTLTFAQDILPYLTQLGANFTKYKLIEIRELTSIHAIRLYELIVCWLGQYQYSKSFEIEEFKYLMGITGKYAQFNQLRVNVIEKAVKEINESTNYKVSVEYKKKSRGKGFEGFTLKFHKKTLDKLAGDDGLSEDKIKLIVSNIQFMNDYNNHPSLSYQGKMDTETFKREMFNIILREPETFNKEGKDLTSYLPSIKQGK